MLRTIQTLVLGLSLGWGTMLPTLAQIEPALIRSFAIPRNVKVPFPKYQVVIEVGSGPLEQIGIGLPNTIRVNGVISAQDCRGTLIPLKVSYLGQQALLTFEHPLPAKSEVTIVLHGIKNTLPVSQTLSLPLTAKEMGQSQLRQFGTARISVKL